MLLLLTGASGVGKTTVRNLLEAQLSPEVECVELGHFGPYPLVRDLNWRQHTAELAVQRAVQLQPEGRHLLLCGDPVPAVEIAAAPSATELTAMAFAFLDATPAAQADRLTARGDDPALLVHHHAFADWMRAQSTDPTHMLEVVTTHGWNAMRWDRIPALVLDWHVKAIPTTGLTPAAVAAAVKSWISAVLSGSEPTVSPPVA